MTDVLEAIAANIAEQRKPHEYVFPGSDTPIAIRILLDEEMDHARIEAQRYCAKLKADLTADPDFLEREVERQIVWRSVLHPSQRDKGEPVRLWASDADVRKLPTVTIGSLFSLYLEHQERVSPMRKITGDDLANIVREVRANKQLASIQLSQLEHPVLVKLVISLAEQPAG